MKQAFRKTFFNFLEATNFPGGHSADNPTRTYDLGTILKSTKSKTHSWKRVARGQRAPKIKPKTTRESTSKDGGKSKCSINTARDGAGSPAVLRDGCIHACMHACSKQPRAGWAVSE